MVKLVWIFLKGPILFLIIDSLSLICCLTESRCVSSAASFPCLFACSNNSSSSCIWNVFFKCLLLILSSSLSYLCINCSARIKLLAMKKVSFLRSFHGATSFYHNRLCIIETNPPSLRKRFHLNRLDFHFQLIVVKTTNKSEQNWAEFWSNERRTLWNATPRRLSSARTPSSTPPTSASLLISQWKMRAVYLCVPEAPPLSRPTRCLYP